MSEPSKIYFDPDDVDARLAQLGLERETFDTAAKENYAAWAAVCTPHHPVTFPGQSGWAEMNRSIADSLVIARWGAWQSERNLPLVVNNAGTMAITASSGDEDTGRKDGFPCTSSAKGPRTAQFVKANKQQKFAFMEAPADLAAAVKKPGRSTWIFLVFRDLVHNELRYELSRPIDMSEDGHVDDWVERIIFPPFQIDPDVRLTGNGNGTGGESPEISVDIKKLN